MKYQPTVDLVRLDTAADSSGGGGRRARVLVSAFAFSPEGGSEPAVGWHIASRLAQWYDVTVLCSPGIGDGGKRRAEIEDYSAMYGRVPGLTVRFVEPPALSRWLQADGRRDSMLRGLYYIGYRAWQRKAYREAVRLHRERAFDLVHQLTFTGYREPGYLWRLAAPFVWGPLGGVPELPWSYFPLLSWRDKIYYGAKELVNGWQKKTARRSRQAARAAKQVWVNSEPARQLVRDQWGGAAALMPETGTMTRGQAAVRHYDPGRPLRIVWSGLHIGLKALPILLHAMKRVRTEAGVQTALTVLGEGTATAGWKSLAEKMELGNDVRWMGKLAHEQAMEEMAKADVLAFTSLQEGTPHVVLEALSLGLPVVCHDCCGMHVVVTDQCGIKVGMKDPAGSIEGFAGAIRKLAGTQGLVEALSRGALVRARHLSWDHHAAAIANAYERILGERARKDVDREETVGTPVGEGANTRFAPTG